jgi:ssDNA-binding Zn-finger/Zn-ribbon topoisomerase 1
LNSFLRVAFVFPGIICSGCTFDTELRISRWVFLDHFWLSLTLFLIILFIITLVIKRLFAKTCPDCLNIWVPKQAKVCQKCGHRFTAEQQQKTVPVADRVSEAFEGKSSYQPAHKQDRKKFRSREEYERWRDEQLKTILTKKD